SSFTSRTMLPPAPTSTLVPYTTLFRSQEDSHPEVLTYDLWEVTKNTMFICKGAAFKEEYLTSAVEKGAILYISEKEYDTGKDIRSQEHTSELQSRFDLVCRLLLEK